MKQKFFLFGLLIISVLSASAQVPSPRYGHSVCKINSVYYIFGGTLLDNNKNGTKGLPVNDIYSYVPSTQTFSKITNFAPGSDSVPGISGHNAVVYNNEMYVFHGERSEATNSSTFVFTPGDTTDYGWREIIGLPPLNPKNAFNGTRGDATYFAGGYDLSTNSASTECWKYNFNDSTWESRTMMQFGGRYAGASAMIGSKFYLFGGMSDSGPTQTLFVYDVGANGWTWEMYPSGYPIGGIFGGTFDAIGNSMFVCGGAGYTLKNTLDEINFSTSLYEFQVDTIANNVNIVKRADGLPPSLYGAGWIDVENNDTLMYMFGGIENITSTGDTTLTNNFFRYNITDDLVQQYDTVQHTWGAINSINETEFDKNINLQVYPNPATSEINFDIPNNETIKSIKIFNQNGQLVKQITNPDKTSVTVSDLNTGVYFIRTDTKTNRYLSKMMKE